MTNPNEENWKRVMENLPPLPPDVEEDIKILDNLRQAVLSEAMEAVLVDRQTDYGTPESNFGMIADLWTTYLNVPIRPDQVAGCMILLKLARAANARRMDNAVDIAGYAACMFEVDSR